jgi:hypothetical protein
MSRSSVRVLEALAIAGALALPTGAAAQVADASAVPLGLAGAVTATARGLSALSSNPAGLAMPGSGPFTLALLPVQVRAGLHPITLADLADYEGVKLPRSVQLAWLDDVIADGEQTGSAGVDVSAFALTTGRVGVQLSTLAVTAMDVTPAIAELLLMGNAGRTDEAANLTLGGSELDGFMVTTASASLGVPLTLAGGSMALGATLKYSIGHVLAAGREQSGSTSSDEIDVSFPVVATADDAEGVQGSGVGLDVGFQMERGRLGFGAAVLNLLGTFAWDEDKLAFRDGRFLFNPDGVDTEFDERPFDDAPEALADAVDELGFKPIVAVGGSYRVRDGLTLSADVKKRLGGGLAREPELQAGVGIAYAGLQALELRGGIAAVTGGVQLAGGTTVRLGPVNLSFAGALQKGDADANLAQLTVSFGGR